MEIINQYLILLVFIVALITSIFTAFKKTKIYISGEHIKPESQTTTGSNSNFQSFTIRTGTSFEILPPSDPSIYFQSTETIYPIENTHSLAFMAEIVEKKQEDSLPEVLPDSLKQKKLRFFLEES